MTFEMGLVFLIIGVALYLFASEKLPLDISALVILVTITSIPLLFHGPWLLERGIDLRSAFPTVSEGLSGLSSTATVTVLAMFILSAGIQRSGLIHVISKRVFPLMSSSETRQILVIALLVAPISGFINNTAAVAVTIPLVLNLAERGGYAASRLLLPLSFFGMLGGTLTLIGTSTNILASSILVDVPEFSREIDMFEFTHLGLIVLTTGLTYFLLVGRLLLPKKDPRKLKTGSSERVVIELAVPEESDLVGQALEETDFLERSTLDVLRLVRDGTSRIKRATSTALKPGDVLMVRGNLRQIMDQIKAERVVVLSDFGQLRRVRDDGYLVRVLLRNRMLFAGRTGEEVDFWERYRARLIGMEAQEIKSRRLGDEPLHVGEVVLLQISETALKRLRRNPDVVVLQEFDEEFDKRRMWIAGGIVAAVVLAAALTPLPIVVTALIGVIAMVITGCIQKEDVYKGVAWDVIFLLAGVIPLGIAMTKSGAAAWLGGLLADFSGTWHPVFVLMALYAITTLLTEIVSNNAAVVILVPVAVSLAQTLGVPVFPVVLVVMFAASTSFLSPVGYQTNTMIYGTGLYKFTDFAKVGAPLNALLMVVTSIAIWILWEV